MHVLLTGAHGQVGRELAARSEPKIEFLAFDYPHLDITDETTVRNAIADTQPDIVINAAAYTAVDKAEAEQALAFAVNETGAHHLAAACSRAGIPLIHLSTDYVFDGKLERSYRENDSAAPPNVYGESKWRGEEGVRELLAQHVILRTSGIFSAVGHNFVKTMLRLAQERNELRVVADQQTCPTAAAHIADAILTLVKRFNDNEHVPWGTYHYRDAPPVTWHNFAAEILEIARCHQTLKAKTVTAITTADYPTPARRPANAVLDCEKIERTFGIEPRPWKEYLEDVIKKLCEQGG